ncbi:MAG: YceI family protein [Pseudobdellovibrionaceae bacterium]
MKSTFVLALTAVGVGIFGDLGITAEAAPLKVTKGHVEFLAIGKPSAIKIRGKGDDLKSDLQWKDKQVSGKFSFNLDSLDTGIDLRTHHMKEKYLETGKYKNADLELKSAPLAQDPCKEVVKLTKAPFEGLLKLHGAEQPVKGEFDVSGEKGKGHAQIRFNLNITDYKIEIPVYLGIKVADQVQNTVDLDWSCAQ